MCELLNFGNCYCGRVGKQELRTQIRAAKRLHTSGQLADFSKTLCDKILKMPIFQSAHTLLLYSPLPDEVDVFPIVSNAHENGKTVLLPKVVGNDLELHIYKGVESLERGAFGILEPTGEVFFDYDTVDVAIIPGMAFDKAGHRLGRGKGFYDRMLPRLKNAYKIGVCFPFQYLDEIPCEAHDVRMDCVEYGG
ncbi:MAG: 5-formyltetrahydrofolate cyclo-ligase [Bacteroidales bacterium]|nr:5-formyltetrahydrofolate cyclo-ligase [Bacteroidales bacterium]